MRPNPHQYLPLIYTAPDMTTINGLLNEALRDDAVREIDYQYIVRAAKDRGFRFGKDFKIKL